MLNTDLTDIIHRAEGGKVVLDLVFLVVFLLLLWILFGRRTELLIALTAIFLIIYGTNENMGVQTITQYSTDNQWREIIIQNTTTSPFTVSLKYRLIMHVPVIFSGVLQTIHRLRGDGKFELSKRLACSFVINSTGRVVYRSRLGGDPPKKMIFLCQHGSYLIDIFSFWGFIPKDHKLSALNDVTRGLKPEIIGKIWYMLAENLYGVYPIDRADKQGLKTQVSKFVDVMLEDENRVFTIWPSGDIWNGREPNGVKEFKLGAFFMSAFTGVPVCVIHGRLSRDETRFIVEQSNLIYPPELNIGEKRYIDFYDNETYRERIDQYRLQVEEVYREMDNRIYKEVNA
jgi:hypothetical protein